MAKYNVGMEMIHFQTKSNFKDRLKIGLNSLIGMNEKELADLGSSKALSDEIFQETGLRVNVNVGTHVGPAVQVPSVHRNNVLVNQVMRKHLPNIEGMKRIQNAGGLINGSVDIRKGKVSGVFSEIEHTIYLPRKALADGKLNAEEFAAVLMHEIGHLFTYYEYITRTVTTNQVIAGVADTLTRTNNPDEIEAVLISAQKALNLQDLDVKKLTRGTDRRVVEMVVVTSAMNQIRSELGTDLYDANSAEMLADNYVARYGAGRELITALEKLQSWYHSSYRSTGLFLFMEALKVCAFLGGMVAVGAAMPLLAKLSFSSFVILFSLDLNPSNYDRPGVRAKRIRDQVVEHLKQPNLPKDVKEKLKEDLVLIDESLKQINDRHQLFTKLGTFFIKSVRERYQQEKIQKELESLIANDLFLLSDELKGI